MKKIIAYLLAMVMLLTTMSTCVISVSADEAGVATTEGITEEIFTETFEDYTKDVNWLDNIENNFVKSEKTGVKPNDWHIPAGSTGSTGANIMVVDAATENLPTDGKDRGQVLKFYAGKTGTTMLTAIKTVNNTGGTMGDVSSNNVIYDKLISASKGRKLVYEVEYFVPSDFATGEAHFMTNAGSLTPSGTSGGDGSFYSALSGRYNHYFRKSGSSSVTYYSKAQQNFNDRGKWHTMKIVVDYTKASDANYWNTSRLYQDGTLVSAKYTVKKTSDTNIIPETAPYELGDEIYDLCATSYPTSTRPYPKPGNFYGWIFSAKNSTSYDGKAIYYINNLSAYWLDALKIGETKNTENYKSGVIEIPFNSQIQEKVVKYNPEYVLTSNTTKYNSETTTKTLNELITIVDTDNKLIKGAVKSVSLSEDKKTVLVTPDMTVLSGNKEYKIAIDPLFCDVHGQALTETTTSLPVPNYVKFMTASSEFTARVDKESISATEGDDEISATVTLSEVATKSDIQNAFTVTNIANGETVTEGWEYTLSADGTKVELDFSSLAIGSYKLTMNEFTASGKPLTNASDIVISISIAEKLATDPLFNETFEDYTKDVNWLNNLSGDFVTSANTNVKENDWYIASKYKGATDAQVMVVDAGDEGLETDGVERGNILMLDGGKDGNTMLSLQKTVNNITNAGEVKNNYITYGKLIDEGSKGRKLVYEVDFYRPTDFYVSESHFMTNSAGLAPAQYGAGGSGFYTSLSGKYTDYIITMGDSDNTYYARAQRNTDNRGAWHNMKVVIDYSAGSGATYWNTARIYLDDVLVTAKYSVRNPGDKYVITPDAPYELEDEVYDFTAKSMPEATRPYPAKGNFYGWVFSAKNGTTYNDDGSVKQYGEHNGKAVYYIDNFKAYWIDALEVGELVNGENYVSGDIEIPFNSEIKEKVTKYDVVDIISKRSYLSDSKTTTKNYKDLIWVVDEKGDVVDGALSNIRLSDNKRSLIVTPDMNVLWGGRKYRIAIDPLFSDVFGQAFTGNTTSLPKTTYVEFTTAKNDSLSISSASNATIEGSNVSTTIELSNVAGASKSAFLAVAVYNKNYEMIGIATTDVTVDAKGIYSAPVTVDITGYTSDDVAFVKAHLWTSFADMIAYQPAENIGL